MNKFPISIKKDKGSVADVVFTVLAAFLIVVFALQIIVTLRFTAVYVVGDSMLDTLIGADSSNKRGGDYVYIDGSATPERGDIVVIDKSRATGKVIIKRVIALGGDTVELKRGVLYLNGERKEELYVSEERNTANLSVNTFAKVTVPEGYMFCMGDNRDISADSRGEYGMIAVSDTIGVVTDWSLTFKDFLTGWNTFFDTLAGRFTD